MDILSSSFRGDPSAKTLRREVSQPFWGHYLERYLLVDGIAALAGSPRLWTFSGPVPARGEIGVREITLDQFVHYMAKYWEETEARNSSGKPFLRDLVCSLGLQRSAENTEYLVAFKEMATLALRVEMESLLRFNQVRPICVQVFHVFEEEDTSKTNYHTHNLILWK